MSGHHVYAGAHESFNAAVLEACQVEQSQSDLSEIVTVTPPVLLAASSLVDSLIEDEDTSLQSEKQLVDQVLV